MKKILPYLPLAICWMFLASGFCKAQKSIQNKSVAIENFDDGEISLESFPIEDNEPDSWTLESGVTYQNSPFSLKIYGNTWKTENITAINVDSGDVWQVSAYIQSVSEIQGFGIMDNENLMFYSFAGTEEIELERWINVYQGAFPENQWNNYQLPIADDWLAIYGYLPQIEKIVFINDNDVYSPGIIYFDEIINISEDLPCVPKVSINYSKIGQSYFEDGLEFIDIQFFSEVIDEDSEVHDYFWDFGDGNTSNEAHPLHSYQIEDNHLYTTLLQVVDPTEKWGRASCNVKIDSGASSFPVRLNFVGDIMMARRLEASGGVIPTQGVEALFEPTRAYLKDSADITVANLECPLTTHWQQHPTKSICFKGSPANIDGLTYAGIDIVTLANNHILDYLQPGMQETISVLEENSIIHFGAGNEAYEAYMPVFYSKSGVNFAFIGASDRTGEYNNYQPFLQAGFNKPGFANLQKYYIQKQIDEAKKVSDFVIIEWHSGIEYATSPNKQDSLLDLEDEGYSPFATAPSKSNRELRQYAIDNGADLVICHHPHVTNGLELYNGKLIAHSLGNFIFDQVYCETFPSMLINSKVDDRGFYEFNIIPIYIDDYVPQIAQGELAKYILNDLAYRSKEMDTYLQVNEESCTGKIIMDIENMVVYENSYSENVNFEEFNGVYISNPLKIEHPGKLSKINELLTMAEYEYRLGKEIIWFGNMEDEGCSLWDMDNANESFCDTSFYSGLRSIQHMRQSTVPLNLITELEKRLICRSDTSKYSLVGYIKTQDAKDVTIEVQYSSDRLGYYFLGQQNIGISIDGTTPWTFYHKELEIPSGTKFFNIRLNSNKPNEGTAYSWFDDVRLIQWSNWESLEGEQEISSPNDFYYLQFKTEDSDNQIEVTYTVADFEEDTSSIHISEKTCKDETSQLNISPNPFNPELCSTLINFNMPYTKTIKISVLDIFGREINILAEQNFPKGNHTITWNGRNNKGNLVDNGIYIIQVETGNEKWEVKCLINH